MNTAPADLPDSPRVQAAIERQAERIRVLKRRQEAIAVAQKSLGMDDSQFGKLLANLTGGQRVIEALTPYDASQVCNFFSACIQLAGGPPNAPDLVLPRRKPPEAKAALMDHLCRTLTLLSRASGQPHLLEHADLVCEQALGVSRIEFVHPTLLRQVLRVFHGRLCEVAIDWPPADAMPPWDPRPPAGGAK